VIVARSWLSLAPAAPDAEAFNGLFAQRSFEAGEVVCVYQGVVLKTTEALRLPVEEKGYLMRLGPQCYVDARPCPLVLARYINDPINPAGYNVRFDKLPDADPPRALVVAIRSILAGEELFANYGKWYWAGCCSVVKPVRIAFSALHAHRQGCRSAGGDTPSEATASEISSATALRSSALV